MYDSYDPVDKNIVDVSKKRSASQKAVREFRTRLSLEGLGTRAHEQELLSGYARNQANSFFITAALILLVATISTAWTGWIMAVGWAVIALSAHGCVAYDSRKFLAQDSPEEEPRKWQFRFTGGQLLMGGAWTIYAAIGCEQCEQSEFLIIQFSTLLVFVTATSMMSLALGNFALVAVVPPALFLAAKLGLTGETAFLVMAVILVGSVVFSQVMAQRFHFMLLSMLHHATENETLIAELETEKSFSEAARQRAEDANLAKSRFLATMSHELRTPLNAILGFSEIIRDEVFGPVGSEKYKDYVNDIHSSGSHLLKLINEILDISRIEAGKHELREEYLPLVTIVDGARRTMEVKARQKSITITTSYEKTLRKINVDERAIHQIMLNLLSNALKFTPNGGAVHVRVGWTSNGGQYVSIRDTGPGIPQEEIPIVLSSFGQGSIAIKHAEPGTGLGLSIVQALLQVHQGRFELKSKLRVGTEATAYFPQSRVQKQQAAHASSYAESTQTEQLYAKAG